MTRPNKCTVQRRDDGGYEVLKHGGQRAIAVTDTQAEGMERIREILGNGNGNGNGNSNGGGGELAVRGLSGRIRVQDTIRPGDDPRSSRG